MEMLQTLRVALEVIGQDFQRNIPLKFRIARPIHDAHPAFTKRRRDLIRTYARSWRYRHTCADYIRG